MSILLTYVLNIYCVIFHCIGQHNACPPLPIDIIVRTLRMFSWPWSEYWKGLFTFTQYPQDWCLAVLRSSYYLIRPSYLNISIQSLFLDMSWHQKHALIIAFAIPKHHWHILINLLLYPTKKSCPIVHVFLVLVYLWLQTMIQTCGLYSICYNFIVFWQWKCKSPILTSVMWQPHLPSSMVNPALT